MSKNYTDADIERWLRIEDGSPTLVHIRHKVRMPDVLRVRRALRFKEGKMGRAPDEFGDAEDARPVPHAGPGVMRRDE